VSFVLVSFISQTSSDLQVKLDKVLVSRATPWI
jgi:hypothetical protein